MSSRLFEANLGLYIADFILRIVYCRIKYCGHYIADHVLLILFLNNICMRNQHEAVNWTGNSSEMEF